MKSLISLEKKTIIFQILNILTLVTIITVTFLAFPANCLAGDVHLCGSVDDCVTHGIDYLIIAANELEDTSATYFNPHVDTLAEHRADFLGLNVGIVNTNSITPLYYEPIRNFIKAVYDSASAAHMADGHIGFVLLVGDKQDDEMNTDMVPTYYYSQPTYASDHYYACVTCDASEEYDDFPDLMIGRLSVGTAQDPATGDFIELRGAVNKTIAYNSLSHAGWADNILLSASASPHSSDSQDTIQFGEHLDTLRTIIPDSYSVDEIRGWRIGNPNGVRAAIISAINDGRWIVNFAGHGAQTYWKYRTGGASVLSVDDLDSLENEDEYPMMFADACKTGWFDNTGAKPDDCIGEELVNADTCGAIAYVGASRVAYFPGGTLLIKSAHRALFCDHAYFTGEMVAAGKITYLSKRDKSLPHNSAHNFNLFGDPAVNLMWSVSDNTNRPDLVVSQSDITISPISEDGDHLALSAVVENKGPVAVADTFSVLFFKGDPALGDTIGSIHKVPGLSAWYGSETISDTIYVDSTYMWRDKIYVVADYDNQITEIYEDNNTNWNWHSLYLFPVTQVGTSSPVIANLVGDSDPEVIIAGNCWGKDGLAWSFSKDASEVSSPAVGDIDNDGDQEVVLIFGGDSLFVYENSTQEYAWGSGYSNTKIYGSATLAYLDDNDTLDIVFGLSSCDGAQDTNRVVALQAQGASLKTLWNRVINTDSTAGAILSPPAIGDVDSDGKPEVIVLSENGSVYALNGENGDTIWVSEVGVNSASAPAMADLDEDGELEIVVCTGGDSLICLKGEDGQKETSRSYYLGDISKSRSPCIGDIDGDRRLEVVFQADTTLFVLNWGPNLKRSANIPDAAVQVAMLTPCWEIR